MDIYEIRRLEILSEDGSLSVRYGNRGEPYRDGIEIAIEKNGKVVMAFLDLVEAKEVKDKLSEFIETRK